MAYLFQSSALLAFLGLAFYAHAEVSPTPKVGPEKFDRIVVDDNDTTSQGSPSGLPLSSNAAASNSRPVSAKILSVGDRDTIVISQNDKHRWRRGDKLCVTRNEKEITCGTVTLTTSREATVKLTTIIPTSVLSQFKGKKRSAIRRINPHAGDRVTIVSQSALPSPPNPSNLNITVNVTSDNARESRTPRHSREPSQGDPEISSLRASDRANDAATGYASIGYGIGNGYSFPLADLQFATSNRLSLGLMPLYLNSQKGLTQQTAYGGFFTLSVYLEKPTFNGFFLQGAAGIYSISAKNGALEESSAPPAAFLVMGWRGEWGGINVGLSGGLQYVSKPKTAMTLVDYSGALPMLLLDVGHSFGR